MTFVEQLRIEHANFVKKEAAKFAKKQAKEQAAFMRKQQRQAKAKRADKSMLRKEEFHYTDASKYAKTHYGETLHETTRHDTDWGDY